MNEQELKRIFQKAEELVKDLSNNLQPIAFEIVVEKLLMISEKEGDINISKKKSEAGKQDSKPAPNTEKTRKKATMGAKDQVMNDINNGFFDSPKTLSDLMNDYKRRALTTMTRNAISMALMNQVRKGTLERGGEGNIKSPWAYKKI